jgi:hypothetical protein
MNTFKYIQVHSNTLKYIDIYYKYIEIYHKCTINTLKYIHIFSNTLKDIEIHYKDTIHTFK